MTNSRVAVRIQGDNLFGLVCNHHHRHHCNCSLVLVVGDVVVCTEAFVTLVVVGESQRRSVESDLAYAEAEDERYESAED